MKIQKSRSVAVNFMRDEHGATTILSIFLIMSLIMFGGVSADVQNVMAARSQLQMTADAVAHAALVYRETNNAADSKTKALAVGTTNLPTSYYGTTIELADIKFGTWNDDAQKFTVSDSSTSGVRVVARRDTTKSNPIGTFLLWIVGLDEWDVSVTSTFETYHPSCFREGFVAQKEVDIQSNDNFFNGFCIHSNDHVEINQNNYFEAGTRVSMPDLSLLELPASGFTKNTGLQEALVEGSLNIRVLPKIDSILTGVQTSGSSYYPSYITSSTVVTLTKAKPEFSQFIQGRIMTYTCNGGGGSTLTLPEGTFKNMVIITNCSIKFSSNAKVESSVIATTSTDSKSVQGASGMTLGKADDCAAGGESQIVTKGGFYSASGIGVNGSQILAAGDIQFSAQGDGTSGVSMIAGGLISGTSNMNMKVCGNMEDSNFQAEYFRLVR